MGVRKPGKRKVQFTDGEKRPPFGGTKAFLEENERIATLLNRIAALETTIAGYSRGDELSFLGERARGLVDLLSRTGLYGATPREVVTEIVHATLRSRDVMADAS